MAGSYGDPASLPALLRRRADAESERTWLEEVSGARLTYGQAVEQSLAWASAFEALGVKPGMTVLSMVPTSIDAVLAWLGVAWLRGIETGVNPDYHGRMLAYVVEHSRAEVMVIASKYVARLKELPLAGLRTIVVTDDDAPTAALPSRVIGRGEHLAAASARTRQAPTVTDIACMMYTSGTTGPSKGVLVPWGQLHATSPAEWSALYSADEAQYVPYPMNHVGGKVPLYLMAWHHARAVLRERWSGSEFWDDVRRHGCTLTILAGAMQAFLWHRDERPDDADNPLRYVIMLPVLPQHEEFSRRFGVRILTGYNMTEISTPIVAVAPVSDWRSCGRLRSGYPGYEVRLVDEDDRDVAPGQVGELVVRTAAEGTLNAGYFGDPVASARAWRNGWFHTDDAFVRDVDGNYFFVDRLKDAIRRRGENISSFEVESFVNEHPMVAESAAIAVPSEWGEDEVKIVVVPVPGSELDPAGLIAFLEPRVPRFMVPRYVEIVDALPKTDATMRVRKADLRVDPVNDRTWDREAAPIEAE